MTLTELLIAAGIGIIVLLAVSSLYINQVKSNQSVSNVVDADTDANLVLQVLNASIAGAIPAPLWLNSAWDTALQLNPNQLNPAGLAQAFGGTNGALGGSIFWLKDTYFVGITQTPPPLQINTVSGSNSDILEILQTDLTAPILTLTPSGAGNGDYVIPNNPPIYSLTFNYAIATTFAAGSYTAYQKNDVVGMSMSGGVQFAVVDAITSNTITLHWGGLGTFTASDGTNSPLPQMYISSGTSLFRPTLRLIGQEQPAAAGSPGIFTVLQVDIGTGQNQVLFADSYAPVRMQAFDPSANAPVPVTAPTNFSTGASSYTFWVDFLRPSLTGVASSLTAPGNNITTIKVQL